MDETFLGPVSLACDDLCEVLTNVNDKNEREKKIVEHIKHCTNLTKGGKMVDFKPGLEWFNVSKALSLKKDLKGKVVVLDFFTYCCINCMHILPHLKLLEEEFTVQDGVVVVGIHSAKFDNEKDSGNIKAAVQRYGITHPVMNDSEGSMWNTLGIACWPTLLVLGPEHEVIYMSMGEGNMDLLFLVVRNAVTFYRQQNQLSNHALPTAPSMHLLSQATDSLLFPGKVASFWRKNDQVSQWLAVSDTGHHRIVLLTEDLRVEHVVGGLEPGFKDGSFTEAQFNCPQGIAFQNNEILLVADTENHAIREINLKTLRVTTVAGNGTQGSDYTGGGLKVEQKLSSPWDLCIVKCPDSDAQVLLIAMAGLHQIWALFLEGGLWWKKKKYAAGTCVAIAGNGKEQNHNNAYPHAAAFAQPSGLALAEQLQAVFIADSESSSVRKLSLTDGRVSAVVGGDRNPFNLFCFGDADGKQYDAKLQHPLGVAWSSKEATLYVADSYNHKVKAVDVQNNTCRTVMGSGHAGDSCTPGAEQFSEPGGLCVRVDGSALYIADTNNHCIKMLSIPDGKLVKLDISAASVQKNLQPGESNETEVFLSPLGGTISLTVCYTLDKQLSLTDGAPQKWNIRLPDSTWLAEPSSGEFTSQLKLQLTVPSGKPNSISRATLSHRLFVCEGATRCSLKNIHLSIVVHYCPSASTSISHKFEHIVP
ncbi:NHL repeat-containing protein 2 [Anabrus simplex]|uniref:NHL repeat-containing protein 2 n=1 Tax=Anabrus simplex TaxID=316456 RepID=UPI0035A311F9